MLALAAGLGAGAVAGVVVADAVLGQAVGGYASVVLLAFGTATLVATVGLPLTPRPHSAARRRAWSTLARAALLTGYAAAMAAVPIHLGPTWMAPNAERVVPLLAMGVAAWAVYAAAERLGGNRWHVHAAMLVAPVGLLFALAMTGFGSGFLVLVLPMLVALLAIGAGVAALLRRLQVTPWLAAAVAAPVLAWPVASALPLA